MSSAADEPNRSELHPEVRIGDVHLRVADLDRATAFYRDVLGFDLTAYRSDYAFLSAGGYHHHIGLNTRYSQGGTAPPEGHTGLLHFAILYPDRRELARAVKRILERGHPIGEGQDHGVSVSVYLSDPHHGPTACERRVMAAPGFSSSYLLDHTMKASRQTGSYAIDLRSGTRYCSESARSSRGKSTFHMSFKQWSDFARDPTPNSHYFFSIP